MKQMPYVCKALYEYPYFTEVTEEDTISYSHKTAELAKDVSSSVQFRSLDHILFFLLVCFFGLFYLVVLISVLLEGNRS